MIQDAIEEEIKMLGEIVAAVPYDVSVSATRENDAVLLVKVSAPEFSSYEYETVEGVVRKYNRRIVFWKISASVRVVFAIRENDR